jgi:hypothetical protein
MPNDLETTLRDVFTRMMTAMPEFAHDLLALPEASALTLRDLATLLLLAPGERVGRPAVEQLVGAANADAVIGVLAGHGLIKDPEAGGDLLLGERGREFLDRVIGMRVAIVSRLLNTLPQDERDQALKMFESFAKAMATNEALVEA